MGNTRLAFLDLSGVEKGFAGRTRRNVRPDQISRTSLDNYLLRRTV